MQKSARWIPKILTRKFISYDILLIHGDLKLLLMTGWMVKNYMELTIELTENQFEKLQETARRLGLLPRQVAIAAVTDLLAARDEDFRMATDYVLKKNKELYRRLS